MCQAPSYKIPKLKKGKINYPLGPSYPLHHAVRLIHYKRLCPNSLKHVFIPDTCISNILLRILFSATHFNIQVLDLDLLLFLFNLC